MSEVTLTESLQTWLVVIIVMIGLSALAGVLVYALLKPIVGWVLEPLEQDND